MSLHGKAGNLARWAEDIRRRETDSARLSKEVPALMTLRFAVTELGALAPVKHTKHVIVRSAPALFVFRCGDALCEGGGHDVTTAVLYSLRGMRMEFTGQHACDGTVGCSGCRRTLEFRAFAEYS
jgi:hypothetical protein